MGIVNDNVTIDFDHLPTEDDLNEIEQDRGLEIISVVRVAEDNFRVYARTTYQ
jgi:hypothetical protein